MLAEHGPARGEPADEAGPDLALQFKVAVGKRYEGTIGVSTRMLFLLSTQGSHRQGPAARHVAVEPVPLGADGRLDRRAARTRRGRTPGPSSCGGGCGPTDRARSTTWRGGRSGRRPTSAPRCRANQAVAVTADLDDTGSTARGLGPPGRSRRHAGVPDRRRRTVLPGARPDDHGVERPRLVPRSAPRAAVRPQRQRRADRLGRWAGGRRVEPARRRQVVTACSRTGRPHVATTHRRAAQRLHRVDGRRARDAAVPDAARPPAGDQLSGSGGSDAAAPSGDADAGGGQLRLGSGAVAG